MQNSGLVVKTCSLKVQVACCRDCRLIYAVRAYPAKYIFNFVHVVYDHPRKGMFLEEVKKYRLPPRRAVLKRKVIGMTPSPEIWFGLRWILTYFVSDPYCVTLAKVCWTSHSPSNQFLDTALPHDPRPFLQLTKYDNMPYITAIMVSRLQ